MDLLQEVRSAGSILGGYAGATADTVGYYYPSVFLQITNIIISLLLILIAVGFLMCIPKSRSGMTQLGLPSWVMLTFAVSLASVGLSRMVGAGVLYYDELLVVKAAIDVVAVVSLTITAYLMPKMIRPIVRSMVEKALTLTPIIDRNKR